MKEKKKNNVLIISDDENSSQEIIKSLSPKDFDFSIVKNTNDALNSLAIKLPSVIISEIKVKNGKGKNKENGYELLKKIRKGTKTKLIPFIFISDSKDKANKEKIEAIKCGADAYIKKPFDPDEIHAYVTSKISHFKEFYLLSITDELTRLFNRREVLKKFINETTEKPEQVLSLALIDLDFFKQVNDVYGHQMGDEVLMVFAKILKSHLSVNFFPTRFGGEEFVILFPGINAKEAKIITDMIRDEFFSHEFVSPKKKSFLVSFSAGISEYPSIGENLSILLSRADQALYSAKKDGRSRTYIFSPVMARNDRFWEYMKKSKGYFIGVKNKDSITKLPFLPHVLEEISNLNFEISSLGTIVLKFKPIFDFQNYYGYINYDFALENIGVIIQKSCEKNFASDIYIGISDFFKTEFTIFFPIIVNFTFNKEKFENLCTDILNDIKNNMKYYPLDIEHSNSIIHLNHNDPKKILEDISHIRKKTVRTSQKKEKFYEIKSNLYNSVSNSKNVKLPLSIENIYNIKKNITEFYYFSNYNVNDSFISYDILLNKILKNKKDIYMFLNFIKEKFTEKKDLPLLVPYIQNISLESFCKIITKTFKDEEQEIYIGINEYYRTRTDILQLNNISGSLPENINLALDNCFIGKDILNFISLTDFKLILLSEHVTRSLHYFKEKIKIINGFKIFLDQMNIKLCAKNIIFEEELQLLHDLNINYASGPIL